MSIGIVASDGTVPIETLIARADSALYQAKIKDVINGLINPETLPGKGEGMKRMMRIVLLALLTGCAGEKGIIDRDGYQLDTRHPAQAAYPRIKVLVIHYTADNFDVSLATLTDKEVSSHYLIPEQPRVISINRGSGSWCRKRLHARSYWRGSTRINDTSIGIELENRGWQKTAGVKSLPLSSGTDCGSDPLARYHRPLPHRAAECGRPCGYRPAAQRRSGAVIPGNSWRSRIGAA